MIYHRTLKNGVRVAVVPIKGLRSVTIEVALKIGAKYELYTEQGLSHFLEHMAFKGTVKRPKPTDIFREMDIKGVDYNAETGLENTSYTITTVRSNLEWAIEMMADILLNSTMPSEEIEKERGVIIEEIKMYKDNPMMGLGSEMMKMMYGDSEIGCWNVSGEIAEIVKVNRDKVAGYRKKSFDSHNMVVVVAGNVEEEDLKLLERYFVALETEGKPEKLKEIVLGKQMNDRELRAVEQGHFAIAVPSFGWKEEKRYPLRMLDLIMTGNSSSRLFEEIRSKRGWAYYVFSISESIEEVGLWGVQVGVAKENLKKAMALVKEMMMNASGTITAEELERAKTYIEGRVELHLDSSEFWAGYVADKWLLEGRTVSPVEELKKLNEVKLDEVVGVCKSIFKADAVRELTVLAE